ncbi:MAG: hypothetical protein ACJAWV_000074 [Flammeovirgaceae bacterium]|jgi:hypothetical protein
MFRKQHKKSVEQYALRSLIFPLLNFTYTKPRTARIDYRHGMTLTDIVSFSHIEI